MSDNAPGRIAFIGAGFMGEALIRGILRAGLYTPEQVVAADLAAGRLDMLAAEMGIAVTADNAAAATGADTIFLAVKPQVLPQVLDGLHDAIAPGKLVVSIAAGVSLATLEGKLQDEVPVVRAMPNLLASIGAGATAMAAGRHAGPEHLARAEAVFAAVGSVVRVEEKLLNAVTAVSGSGPGYICLIVEALADGGVNAGLPRETALRLAAQTVMGTAQLILETGKHPGVVKDQVCSPGGTTIAGVYALERSGLRAALMDAVAAAAERADKLSGH